MKEMNQQMKMKQEEMQTTWKLNSIGNYYCSKCHNEPYYNIIQNYKYCPFCGKKMYYYEKINSDDWCYGGMIQVLPM